MGKADGRLLLVLDADHLLSPAEAVLVSGLEDGSSSSEEAPLVGDAPAPPTASSENPDALSAP